MAQVAEIARAQQHANGTANVLVGRIGAMMSALDNSTKNLGVEAIRQAEVSRQNSESINNVQQAQQQWWDKHENIQQNQQQHQSELRSQHRKFQEFPQWQQNVGNYANRINDRSEPSIDIDRRRSMPQIPVPEEATPPRRMTIPEKAGSAPSTVVYSQTSDPPSFDETRYDDWKREMQWWQEINAGTDQTRLLATVGMRAKGSLNAALREYFRPNQT